MNNTAELKKLYEMILSLPGMNDELKISVKVSRKNILFLSDIIVQGLGKEGDEAQQLASVMAVSIPVRQELTQLGEELLQKAGLTEIHQKLQQFYNSPSSAKLK